MAAVRGAHIAAQQGPLCAPTKSPTRCYGMQSPPAQRPACTHGWMDGNSDQTWSTSGVAACARAPLQALSSAAATSSTVRWRRMASMLLWLCGTVGEGVGSWLLQRQPTEQSARNLSAALASVGRR